MKQPMPKQTPEQDDDIPIETRRELMQCAVSNGRIRYGYLCDLWRRGRRAGQATVASQAHTRPEPGGQPIETAPVITKRSSDGD